MDFKTAEMESETTPQINSKEGLKLKLYKCKDCLNTFNTEEKIDAHKRTVHEGLQVCRFCDEKFPFSYDL